MARFGERQCSPHADGQRMAALPCAYAAAALAGGSTTFRGAGTVVDLLGTNDLLTRLVADGFELHE